MDLTAPLEIYLVVPPGLEPLLAAEAAEKGFADPVLSPGGVTVQGGWPEIWRANLELRGATRVLARIASFRALHLAQLDKRARKLDWASVLRRDVPVRVEATCRGSRIYHAGAAQQRIETALRETLGCAIGPGGVGVRLRIEDDLATISVDTSGEPLYRRGFKQAVGKAPMRESMAALFLRACGHDGTRPVLDPMCGSGTFPIEAAEIAAGLMPGRERDFAFQALATFDAEAWAAMRDRPARAASGAMTFGHDRDAGAIRMSRDNAERAGVAARTHFAAQAIGDLQRPEGPAGLVIVNPPYGGRVGAAPKLLYGLYATLGRVLAEQFAGWRIGIVTSEAGLARATGLPLDPPGPVVAHGGLKVRLWQAGPLR
ncbi:hypothetical protein OCGS_2140 [Oceaniovalibus guishaninsula JLT2003]|uniref:Uncharacterized protein n=1 Tax=Oceaniovalibus guishaninsula JLT2003 TaxID=1231392 RepID=K2GM49_9RHOB|nr:RNA methyltransferase [Oceaniovalibus guishaninsula]EKE43806.1 hypothetical protein OCGS_2140 [Oceaniovalibus guishaninsula JLT2003]